MKIVVIMWHFLWRNTVLQIKFKLHLRESIFWFGSGSDRFAPGHKQYIFFDPRTILLLDPP